MSFANPLLLWGLLGCLLPLAIHLWNQKSSKTVKIGSIGMLKANSPKQSRGLRLKELALLFLRISLVVCLVFWLAGAQYPSTTKVSGRAYFVAPELLMDTIHNSFFDSLGQKNRLHILASGFPAYSGALVSDLAQDTSGYWQWVPKLNDFPADTLFAFVKGYRRQVYGARPSGSKPLQWIVMDGETGKRSPWRAIKKGDSLSLIFVVSQKDGTAFQKETRAMDAMGSWVVENDSLYPQGRNNGVGVAVISYGPIRVTAKIASSLRQEGIYLKKAMEAVANYVGRDMAWSELPLATRWDAQTTDLFIGLGALPPETYDGNYLVYKALPYASKTIVKDTVSRGYLLTAPLDAERLTESEIPRALLNIIYPRVQWESSVRFHDDRQIASHQLQTRPGDVVQKEKAQGFQPINGLLPLFFILGMAERGLALIRKQ